MHFRKIDIQRMPGFENGGFVLDELCPGINLIYGPNASGKSTTARAIQLALWPDTMGSIRPSAIGWLDIDGDEWMVELDTNSFCYQCNGAESEAPQGLPASDVKHRYYLALHELLTDNNRSFAEQIMREAAGGYDVRQAGDSMGFSEKISSPRSLLTELRNRRRELLAARQTQQTLRDEENQLQKIEEERDRARAARERSEWLEKATHYHECRIKKQKSLDIFNAFPPGMDRLVGDEVERLEKNKRERETRRGKIKQAKFDIAEAQQQREGCNLPDNGVPENLLNILRQRSNRLQEIQHEIDRLKRETDKAQRLEREARKRLDTTADIETLERLDRSAIDEFTDFSKKVEKSRANLLAEKELKQWIGEIEEPSSLRQVQEGVDILVRWLNAAEGNGRFNYRWFLISAMLAGAMVIAGGGMFWLNTVILDAPYMALLEGALIFFGLLLFIWCFSAHPNRLKRREWQKEYEELGLDSPETWTIQDVMQKSRHLQKQLAEMNVNREKAMRWAQLQKTIDRHQQELGSLNDERNQLLQKYGLLLSYSMEDIPDAHLTHFISNLVSWQQAHDQLYALEDELRNAAEQFETCMKELQQDLSPYSSANIETVEEAIAAIDELNSRRELFNESTRSMQIFMQQLEDNQKEMEELEREYDALFGKVGIQQGDEATLHEYCRNREVYLSARDDLKWSEHEERQAKESLKKHPEFLERDQDDLTNEFEKQKEMAKRLDELNNRIGGIRRAIEDAKNKDDLERALIEEENILERLRYERNKNYASLIGSLLVNEIENHNRSSNLPEVFHHARRIFSQITRGRYQLRMDCQSSPSFRAFDTSLEKGQSLEELSSGTRLQILMAVRLAFVERQEAGMMLPLLMDESLGNSDDSKAQIIIDSMIELCRTGRQIFYFTAQHDEIGKWLYALRSKSIPHETFDLAKIRNFLETERLPHFDLPSPQHYHPPKADGFTHEEYGRLLSVPEFNPWEPIGNIHLWHVLDDSQALYNLLDRGVNRWGQLKSLVEEYGHYIAGDDSRIYKRADAMSKMFNVLASCLKVGRGKPVDRNALLNSGFVSERFINEVNDLTKQLNGDARRLIQELDGQAISGFRKDKCKDLKEYLIEEGFLDERPTMSIDDVRAQIMSFVSTLPESELFNLSQLQDVIYRVHSHYDKQ